MSENTGKEIIDDQASDSIDQTNVKVVAEAPALAIGNLYEITSHAILQAANAGAPQQKIADCIMRAAKANGISLTYEAGNANSDE